MCIARHSNNHAFLYVEFLVENITKFSQWNYLAIQKSPMRKGKFLTETFFKPVSFFLWVLLIFTFCNCIMRHVFLKTDENLRNLKIIHIHQLIGKCSTWVGFSSSIRLKWVIFITFLDISFFSMKLLDFWKIQPAKCFLIPGWASWSKRTTITVMPNRRYCVSQSVYFIDRCLK